MAKLTNDDCRRLTEEFLKKCWHEVESGYGGCSLHVCPKCDYLWNPGKGNLTFTEPVDFFAVFERLVELREYNDFDEWAFQQWIDQRPFNDLSRHIAEFTKWINSKGPTGEYQLCWLVSKYLKEKETRSLDNDKKV